jgi:hypothetical protein
MEAGQPVGEGARHQITAVAAPLRVQRAVDRRRHQQGGAHAPGHRHRERADRNRQGADRPDRRRRADGQDGQRRACRDGSQPGPGVGKQRDHGRARTKV